MRNPIRILAASLVFALTLVPALTVAATRGFASGHPVVQQSVGALERGYRTGYSDGYQAGYRDGYQQGFEAGYGAGYERRGFNSTIPTNLSRRGTMDVQTDGVSPSSPTYDNGSSSSSTNNSGTYNSGSNNSGSNNSGSSSNSNGPISTANVSFIPSDTVLRVELLTNLSTDATQRGDRFEARG